jgi:hypothetical protein
MTAHPPGQRRQREDKDGKKKNFTNRRNNQRIHASDLLPFTLASKRLHTPSPHFVISNYIKTSNKSPPIESNCLNPLRRPKKKNL